VQLYAFDILAMDGDDLRLLPLSMRKARLEKLLHRRPDGIFTGQLRKARSDLIYFAKRA
jgi:bifunctional non-homologous end joining protein LigD